MANTNKMVIRGRLTTDVKELTSDKGVLLTGSIAVNLPSGGENVAHYYNFRYNTSAERASTLKEKLVKGAALTVKGHLNRRTYPMKDGTTGVAWEIMASRLTLSDSCAEATIRGFIAKAPERHGKIVTALIGCQGQYHKDEKKYDTYFVDVTFFGAIADNVEKNRRVGDQVVVSGQIVNNSFTTKDGKKAVNMRLLADEYPDVVRANRKDADAAAEPEMEAPEEDYAPIEDADDQLPF